MPSDPFREQIHRATHDLPTRVLVAFILFVLAYTNLFVLSVLVESGLAESTLRQSELTVEFFDTAYWWVGWALLGIAAVPVFRIVYGYGRYRVVPWLRGDPDAE